MKNRIATILLALFCVAPLAYAGTITGTPGKLVSPVGKDSTGAWNVLATDANGNALSKDFLFEVAAGNVTGYSIVHKFGRDLAVLNGTFSPVTLNQAVWHPVAVSKVRVKAGGNAADAAAGAGCQEVTVQGIDSNLAELSEAITMNANGTLASALTTATFWRVHRAWCSASGAYGAANTAAINIEIGAGSGDVIQIGVAEGQSQYGAFTIPTGKTGYLLSVTINVDASKDADLKMFKREDMTDVTTPYTPKRLMLYFDGVVGEFDYHPVSPSGAYPALTDIWWEANGAGAVTEVSVDFELLLVDD